jgi:hypothetical protein
LVAPGLARVARQLAADRRRAASQPLGDLAHRLAASPAEGDLLALSERQAATLQIAAAAGAHASGLTHPLQAAPTMRPRQGGRIGEELTGLQSSPERLDRLGDS